MERVGSWTRTTSTNATQGPRLTPLPTVVEGLMFLASVRQAEVTEKTYTAYADALSYHRTEDLVQALRALSLKERREGETAFPSLATIAGECKAAMSNRLAFRALKEQENLYADRAAHPENYVSVHECFLVAADRIRHRALGENIPPIVPRTDWP